MTNQILTITSKHTTDTATADNTRARGARRLRLAHLAPLAAAAALLGTACGSTTTSTSPVDAEAASQVSGTDLSVSTDAPSAGSVPPTTAAPTATPSTIEPALTTTPCGEIGVIPPLPDGMNPQFFDTDGDGEPDSVQAYPSGGLTWTVRVIENGVTSEASLPDSGDFVGIVGSVEVDGRAHVIIRDFANDDEHTVATNTDRCVEHLSTEPGDGPGPDPAGDLVLTNPTIPVPTIPLPKTPVTIDPVLAAPTPTPGPCGDFGPIPAESTITSDLTVDLVGDGIADDQVITYFDGDYTLRSIRDGVVSEVTVPDVGVSSVRALGVGNAGEISPGNEVVVRTGGGASAVEIDFFGHDADGCVFEFTLNGGDLDMYVGATIGTSSGMFCDEGIIGGWYYQLEDDGTYFGSGAAFFESTAGDFTYLPSSDDFSEGLTLDELSPATLDCFGFGL